MHHNGDALFLHGLVLAVMAAVEGGQGFRQADEADGQRAVLQHLADLVGGLQLVGIQPHALPHQEGEVVHVLLRLDLEAVQQLLRHQLQQLVQPLVEALLIAPVFQRDARQVDGGEGWGRTRCR